MTQVIGVTYLLVPTAAFDSWRLALFYDDGAGHKKVIEVGRQKTGTRRLIEYLMSPLLRYRHYGDSALN